MRWLEDHRDRIRLGLDNKRFSLVEMKGRGDHRVVLISVRDTRTTVGARTKGRRAEVSADDGIILHQEDGQGSGDERVRYEQ